MCVSVHVMTAILLGIHVCHMRRRIHVCVSTGPARCLHALLTMELTLIHPSFIASSTVYMYSVHFIFTISVKFFLNNFCAVYVDIVLKNMFFCVHSRLVLVLLR